MLHPDRFLFRLALKLGQSVKWVKENITQEELLQWRAFFLLEPWGCEIEDHRFGMLVSAMQPKTSPLEAFPGYFEPEKKLMKAMIRAEQAEITALNQQYGGVR